MKIKRDKNIQKNFKITINKISLFSKLQSCSCVISLDKNVNIKEIKELLEYCILGFNKLTDYLNNTFHKDFKYFGNQHIEVKLKFIENWLSNYFDAKVICEIYNGKLHNKYKIEDLKMIV